VHENIKTLRAPEDGRLYLWFEPWAEGLGFPPGSVVDLRGVSSIEGELELDVSKERTAVYGWPGSTIQVIVDGEVVHSFEQAVPDAPSKLSTKEIVTMLFGPAPVPDPNEAPDVSWIPEFEAAVSQFRRFLADSGCPEEIVWVFRDDIWHASLSRVFMTRTPDSRNTSLVRKVFADGRRKGLVKIHAVARTDSATVATVWYPKREQDEVQGWDRGMKLSITEPLPRVTELSVVSWAIVTCLPRFRRYQRVGSWIGTRDWAATEDVRRG